MDRVHRVVFDFICKQKRGKILDAGAGEGALSSALKEQGFDVTACDIDTKKFKTNMKCDKLDLNKDLPYKDNSFDHIICIEVAEHLENPHHLIRGFRKVLKRGGILIITIPNIVNIFSRLKFLVTGTFFCFSKKERELGHINPIPYWELKEILERNGFKLTGLETNNFLKLPGNGNLKRFVSILCYSLLSPVLKPKNKKILKGDSLILIAKRVV